MNISQFRTFLTLSWFFGLLSMAVAGLTVDTLPIVLQDFLSSQTNPMETKIDLIYFASGFPMVAGIIVSYIGLYLWKKWARILFISMFLLGFLVELLGNYPIIISPYAEPFFMASYVFSGIVICSMYFCDEIRIRFKEKPKIQEQSR